MCKVHTTHTSRTGVVVAVGSCSSVHALCIVHRMSVAYVPVGTSTMSATNVAWLRQRRLLSLSLSRPKLPSQQPTHTRTHSHPLKRTRTRTIPVWCFLYIYKYVYYVVGMFACLCASRMANVYTLYRTPVQEVPKSDAAVVVVAVLPHYPPLTGSVCVFFVGVRVYAFVTAAGTSACTHTHTYIRFHTHIHTYTYFPRFPSSLRAGWLRVCVCELLRLPQPFAGWWFSGGAGMVCTHRTHSKRKFSARAIYLGVYIS